jgi:hypothetical protein
MGFLLPTYQDIVAIIEAQQRIIDATPNPRIMPTSADRAVTLFSQLVAKHLREEEGSVAEARAG